MTKPSIEALRLGELGPLLDTVNKAFVAGEKCSYRTAPTGEDFIVFSACAPTSVDDREETHRVVAHHFFGTLLHYIEATPGALYVRIYPEVHDYPHPEREGWLLIKCYARLLKSDRKRVVENTQKVEQATAGIKEEIERQKIDFLKANREAAGR